jgi:hypothetical protein
MTTKTAFRRFTTTSLPALPGVFDAIFGSLYAISCPAKIPASGFA